MVFEVKGGHNIFGGIKMLTVFAFITMKKERSIGEAIGEKPMAHNEMQELATQEQVDYILDYIIELLKKTKCFWPQNHEYLRCFCGV